MQDHGFLQVIDLIIIHKQKQSYPESLVYTLAGSSWLSFLLTGGMHMLRIIKNKKYFLQIICNHVSNLSPLKFEEDQADAGHGVDDGPDLFPSTELLLQCAQPPAS